MNFIFQFWYDSLDDFGYLVYNNKYNNKFAARVVQVEHCQVAIEKQLDESVH